MKDTLLQLFTRLYKNEIDIDNLLILFKNKTGFILNEKLCLENLKDGILKCDDTLIDTFIQAGFMVTFTKKSIPVMCELLESKCHHKHEDIAMLLKEIADPNTVDCLYKAVELTFDYLDYDDTYQFARKCIKALSTIGTESAVEKLKLLTSSKTSEIAEYARKELRYKGLL